MSWGAPFRSGTTGPDSRISTFATRSIFWPCLALAISATALVYIRGLHGAFLFDDFANLPSLGAYGPVDNWISFSRYITSGTADPTGRPLALLSFLIDAHDWPADPYPFKRTNLVLHLVNGVLLAALLRRLSRSLPGISSRRADVAAVLAAALWLLHPLLVSTTLYVVQREAMLPATFVLLGLLGYSRGRALAAEGHRRGIWLAAFSVGACTLLAILSKANGVLLPMFAWLIDALILSKSQPIAGKLGVPYAWTRRAILIAPTIALLYWLCAQGIRLAEYGTPEYRPWTIGQRLLTEARILCQYLSLLWLPHPYTPGLFNDSIAISTGLLSPPTTFTSIGLIAALIALAFLVRRPTPAFTLAILFYFSGHLLESTVIPLELYYEHRNYIPAMPLFWPLALCLSGEGTLVPLRRALIFALPVALAFMTFMRADLWGDAQQQALMWAEKNPQSPRAQAYAAAAERARGRPDLAAARMRRVHVTETEAIQIELNRVGAECEQGQVSAEAIANARDALRSTRTAGRLYYEWMGEAIERIHNGSACPGLDSDAMHELLDAMDENARTRRYAGWRQDNLALRARLEIASKDPTRALEYFNRALDAQPRANIALGQAALLGSAGYPEEALKLLDHFDNLPNPREHRNWSMASLHAWLLERQGFVSGELAHLRGVLEQDLRDARAKAKTPSGRE